ncbi:MAG: alanine racemase [Firmicutes bacterium]|nr:alanine racemase [Bacillota bacterium]
MERYPQLVIATKNLQHNFNCLKEMCRPYGIRITAVSKGFTSVPEACQALWECHPRAIATSRIDQVKKIKEYDPSITTELMRIPALSECDLVVKYADISLNSELAVLQKLNQEALKQGKIHRVILMKDIGDRREGFESEDVMIDAASMVEYGMPGLKLYGIGANFGCYGSICVSKDKVDWLAEIMEKIEAKIGRQLDVLSIGGTQSFHNMAQGELNPRVNDIRAGISLITKAEYTWKEDFPERVDAFRIRAEIVELKNKPTMPNGVFGAAALDDERKYVDLGVRKRAILAFGKQDFGGTEEGLTPLDPQIKIWGSSSDHTMLDLEECDRNYKLGDIVEFRPNYVVTMYATTSPNVTIKIVDEF